MNSPDNKIAIQSLQLQQMFSGSNVSLATSTTLAFILALIQHQVIAPTAIFAWLAVVVFLTVFRTALVIHYRRSPKEGDSTNHSRMVNYRIGVIVSGVVWGSASFLMFPVNDPEHQMFLIFILAGLTAGGVATYSADLVCAIGFSVAVLVPLAIRMFSMGGGLTVAMGVAVTLYLGFMILSGRRSNQHIRDNIVLRLKATSREIAIRSSEEQYRLLLRQSPVGIFHYDANLIITYCNDRLAEILESRADLIVGMDMNTLKDQSILPTLKKALDGEIALYEGHYLATISDVRRWIAMTCAPSRDNNENIVGGISILQDITDKKIHEQALLTEIEKNKAIFKTAGDGLHIMDVQGNLLQAGDSFCRMLGYTQDEMLGKNVMEWDASLPSGTPFEELVKRIPEDGSLFETQQKCKDGHFIDVEIFSNALTIQGTRYVYSSSRDITERKKIETALMKSESRFRFMLENSPIAVSISSLANYQVMFANQRYAELIGIERDKVIGTNQKQCYVNPQDYEDVQEQLGKGKRITNRLFKLLIPGEPSKIKWVLASYLKLVFQNELAILGWFYEITDRKEMEEQVQHLAYHDPLTKLPNRLLFTDRLQQALAIAKRDHVQLAVMFIDLDKFKPVNDAHGHHVGDLLLKEVAQRIQDCLRKSDTVARIGGDEYIVLLPVVKAEQDAMGVAEKIRISLNQPFELAGNSLRISSSMGVAIYPEHGDEEKLLLRNADDAMYYAKSMGRDNVKIYRSGMQVISG